MKKLVIFCLFCLVALSVSAQWSVHVKYSELTQTGVGVGYDFDDWFWADFTFSRGTAVNPDPLVYDALTRIKGSAAFNISGNYNFWDEDRYDVYLGLNGGVLLGGERKTMLTAPLGVRIRPFAKMQEVLFQIEIQTILDDFHPFVSLGLHYRF
jgi:opacity protein-like surface antigen